MDESAGIPVALSIGGFDFFLSPHAAPLAQTPRALQYLEQGMCLLVLH